MSERFKRSSSSVVSAQSNMASMSIADSVNSSQLSTPSRPAYGTQGLPVSLYANYLEINNKIPNVDTLFLYTMTASGPGGSPKGRQLQQVIQIMLDNEPLFCRRKNAFATDFAQILISSIDLGKGLPKEFIIKWRKELEDTPAALPAPKIYRIKIESSEHKSININQALSTLIANGITVSQLDFTNQPLMMQVLNVLAAHYSKLSHLIVKVGRNKSFSFDPISAYDPAVPLHKQISNALEVRRGYFSSVRVAKDRVLLNVNPTASLFHLSKTSEGVPMLLSDLITFRSQELGVQNFSREQDCQWLEEIVKGMRVRRADLETRSNSAGQTVPDARTIFGLSNPLIRDRQRETCSAFGSLAKNAYCWDDNGARLSVAEKYNAFYDGAATQQPVVNLGNHQHPDYFLTSMCEVLPGNVSRAKLIDKRQHKAMIDFAVLKPETAKYAIEHKALKTLGLVKATNGHAIPITIHPKMIKVTGRRLSVPPVKYQNEFARQDPKFGGWTMQGLKFSTPLKLENWIVLRFTLRSKKTDVDLKNTVKNFEEEMKLHGMTVIDPEIRSVPIQGAQDPNIGDCLGKICAQGFSLALIVLPNNDTPLYNRVKTAGDVRGGFLTQCVIEDKFMGKGGNDKQYFSNVSMKVNLKLGGTNHIGANLPIIAEGTTMVVGYDVTHPPPIPKVKSTVDKQSSSGKKQAPESLPAIGQPTNNTSLASPTATLAQASKPLPKNGKRESNFNSSGITVCDNLDTPRRSIAAMVASTGSDLAQFPAVVRLQERAGQEMVIKLQDMLETRLDLWAERNGGKYPENVIFYRDGVSDSQYTTVLAEELPLLEAACVNKCGKKRPKITFLVAAKRHHSRFFLETKNGVENPHFGTIVDTGITHDQIWDFLLQSHQPRLGTAKPTHYVILKDEIFSSRGQGVRAVHELESLTNAMCQLNGRATKAVSIVPAAAYADLACTRALRYAARHDFLQRNVLLQQKVPLEQSDIEVHPNLAKMMHYI